jgi:hypothetical protein
MLRLQNQLRKEKNLKNAKSARIRTDTDVLAATHSVFEMLTKEPAAPVAYIFGSGYDSDDEPEALVGLTLKVKWSGDKWYGGRVTEYAKEVTHPEAGKHRVEYEDGDKKWYQITEKNFQIVKAAK